MTEALCESTKLARSSRLLKSVMMDVMKAAKLQRERSCAGWKKGFTHEKRRM